MTQQTALIVRRGGEKLNTDDLRVHLANILRLENVGVFLGAGASVECDGKSMKQVWNAFKEASPEGLRWLATKGLIEAFSPEISAEEQATPNVERLLDKLEIFKQYQLQASADTSEVEGALNALLSEVIKAAMLSVDHWKDPNKEFQKLEHHRKLLQRLIGARQAAQSSPWIFTTNYDLAVEWAAESLPIHVHTGFSGIHNRMFSPHSFDLGLRNTAALGEARFGCNDCYLVKLHGSLNWKKEGEANFRELACSETWSFLEKAISGEEPLDESLMVYPRAAKYIQTVGYLAGELFRRFSDFLARPQAALLIMGYSFSDEHLNRLLRSALLNPTLQIVVFLPEIEDFTSKILEALNPALRQLFQLESPRITFVGGGSAAYFSNAVSLLPDPMIYDLSQKEMKERMFPKVGNSSGGGTNAD